jgi:peptidoglycan hydrolase-like protein with peptidoglycan-binding domain
MALGATVPGGADGVFGPGLEGAIKTFQRTHALDADGAVGPATLRALDAALQTRPQGA